MRIGVRLCLSFPLPLESPLGTTWVNNCEGLQTTSRRSHDYKRKCFTGITRCFLEVARPLGFAYPPPSLVWQASPYVPWLLLSRLELPKSGSLKKEMSNQFFFFPSILKKTE